jgi:hypothetical protein
MTIALWRPPLAPDARNMVVIGQVTGNRYGSDPNGRVSVAASDAPNLIQQGWGFADPNLQSNNTAWTVTINGVVQADYNVKNSGGWTFFPGTAVPAGGTAGLGIQFSSVAGLGIFFGSGAPTLAAAQGSLYVRTDGSSTSTRLYVNTNGSTTWTAVTTAA